MREGPRKEKEEERIEGRERSKSGQITDYFALRHPRLVILSHLKLPVGMKILPDMLLTADYK